MTTERKRLDALSHIRPGASGCRSYEALAAYLERRAGEPVNDPPTMMSSKEYTLCALALRHLLDTLGSDNL